MKNSKNLHNDKGFTLLELLIVLTISAIMVLFIGLTLGMINGANVNKAAKSCEQALVQGRVQTMAKGPSTNKVYLWVENGRSYVKVGDDGEKEQLCDDRVTTKFVKVNTVDNSVVATKTFVGFSESEATALCFVFNNVGAINKAETTVGDYNGVQFERGTRHTVVYICPETGKTGVFTY